MKYFDYYLTAPNEEMLRAAIPDGFLGVFDFIGTIYTLAIVDDEGNVTSEPTAVDGYHANMRLPEGVDVPESLNPYLINKPQYPKRVWA